MWILVSATFTASLLGSLHCVGMCGPLALWASGAEKRTTFTKMLTPTSLYHLGRLFTYTLVGFMAGFIGQLLDWSGESMGVQTLAARIVGSAMVLVGLIAVWRHVRQFLISQTSFKSFPIVSSLVRSKAEQNTAANNSKLGYLPPQPNWITRQLIRLRPKLFGYPLAVRAIVVGLLTALLPCGWLYLFALLAAGTGSGWMGAGLMTAFWLGSVPALVSLVASTHLLRDSLRRVLPLAVPILLIFAGVYTVTGRGLAELDGKWSVSNGLVDQLHTGKPIADFDANDIREGMTELVSTPLPCCHTTEVTSESPISIQAGNGR